MKEKALLLVKDIVDPTYKLNILREYLQAFTLRSLHESKAFQCLSFVGGTSLHFLFDLPRFSEDLDFSLENPQGYDFRSWLRKIKRDLSYAGFNVTITWNDHKILHIGWIRVEEIMKEAGLTAIPEQKISIKLEIDIHPPAGAIIENNIVNRHMIFVLRHHDLSSLMAGKIHALCTRKYLKGRDWYDLIWYRTHQPPVSPNLKLLENALNQTENETSWEAHEWEKHLIDRLNEIDLDMLVKDIAPFLEHSNDITLLTRENIRKAITGEYPR